MITYQIKPQGALEFLKVLLKVLFSFFVYVNNTHQCSTKVKFYLFVGDTDILFVEKKITKKPNYKPKIRLLDKEKNEYATLESKDYIKYLGILIDKNLTWGPFLKSPGNFTGPKSNIQIEI